MTCQYASSGCNFPEGECLGLCVQSTQQAEEPMRVKMLLKQIEVLDFSIAKKDAALKVLIDVATRYRNETPLGHQPHMIAHVADAAITQGQKAL
jgi:hypothetical protein